MDKGVVFTRLITQPLTPLGLHRPLRAFAWLTFLSPYFYRHSKDIRRPPFPPLLKSNSGAGGAWTFCHALIPHERSLSVVAPAWARVWGEVADLVADYTYLYPVIPYRAIPAGAELLAQLAPVPAATPVTLC